MSIDIRTTLGTTRLDVVNVNQKIVELPWGIPILLHWSISADVLGSALD
jgi:hypothetical protein